MEETREEPGKKYAKLIAKAWSDESFKEKLLTNSRAVFEAEGISMPPGANVKVLEQTDTQFFMVIPKKPEGVAAELLDERAAAGCYYACY
jgi:hypothetical protein